MPKLNQKGVVHIFALIILVIGLIVGLYLVTHPTIFKPKASGGDNLQIINSSGGNDTTDNPNVHLKINLPDGWVVSSPGQSFNLVKPVLAQESCKSDCGSCTTVNNCGYTTYDNCTDNAPTPGTTANGTLCTDPKATKFSCKASGNGNCQSNFEEYECSYSIECSSKTVQPFQPQVNQTSKPVAVHIIQKVIIENKDTDGSSNGSPKQDISNDSDHPNKIQDTLNSFIPWELEHLQANQPQAQRYVQVTLFDGKEYKALPANILLTRKTNIQGREITNDDNSSQNTPSDIDYADWVTQMQSLGVYPAKENGEIVLYDRKTFVDKYCGSNPIPGTNLVSTGCYLNPPPFAEVLADVQSDVNLIKDLGVKLKEEGYAPLTVLKAYFPEIINTDQSVFLELKSLEPCNQNVEVMICPPGSDKYRTEISQEELRRIIGAVFLEKHLAGKENLLIKFSDPIFGTRALISWATLAPNKVTDEERINALLGITVIYGLSEKVVVGGIDLSGKVLTKLPTMIDAIKTIRGKLVVGEEKITLESLRPQIERDWLQVVVDNTSSTYSKFAKDSTTVLRFGESFPGGGIEEFEALSKLYRVAPDNVARPIELISEGDKVIGYKMEYIKGMTVRDYIERHRGLPGDIRDQIISTLQTFHKNNLAHGDPNFSNIIVTAERKVKFIDPVAYTDFEPKYATFDLDVVERNLENVKILAE